MTDRNNRLWPAVIGPSGLLGGVALMLHREPVSFGIGVACIVLGSIMVLIREES